MIFGRANEEIAALRAARVPIEIIPGVTAALGAAAGLQISLTPREKARRLQFITAHAHDGKLPLVSTGFAWWRSVEYLRARDSGGENRMRRLIFGTIIGSLVAIAAVAAAIYYYERPCVLRIAVPRDSDDQAIMAAAT